MSTGARITGLNSHPARPAKVRIYIDDKYAFELSRKAIRSLGVADGEILAPERRRQIEAAAARESAIGLLARRERSRAELQRALIRKRFDTRVIEDVLCGIEKEGAQSDVRFAHSWIETRHRLSPRGKAALAYELKQRGIGQADVASALTRIGPGDELESLRKLIASRVDRFNSHKDDKTKFKLRLLGFLTRRGFAYSDIRTVLSRDFPQWS